MGLVESGKIPKPLTKLLNLSRKYSIWAYQWGLACCAIEMGAAFASPRYDVMRLGVIPFPASPRQADLVVISGTVTDKIVPAIKRLYEQMPDPKYVISMGSCTNCGGPYWDSYSVTKGVDQIVPVDVYVPGCPPRPEALLEGIVLLQERIHNEDMAERWRGRAQERGRSRSSLADDATTTDEAPAVVTDDRREALLAVFSEHLGDAVVDSLIKPGQGLWIRVATAAWGDAAEVARDKAGCRFFDFLSAIDWLPSPYGRYEDSNVDVPFPPPDARPVRRRPRLRRRRQPAPGPGVGGQGRHRPPRAPQGRRPRRRPADRHVDPRLLRAPRGTSARRTRCSASAFDGNADLRHIYLPTEFEGHPLRKEFPLLARVVKPWPGIVDVEPMPGEDPPRKSRRGGGGA